MTVLLVAGRLPSSAVQGVAEAAVGKQHSSHQGAKPGQHSWRPCENPLLAGKLQKNPTLKLKVPQAKAKTLSSPLPRISCIKALNNHQAPPRCRAGIAARAPCTMSRRGAGSIQGSSLNLEGFSFKNHRLRAKLALRATGCSLTASTALSAAQLLQAKLQHWAQLLEVPSPPPPTHHTGTRAATASLWSAGLFRTAFSTPLDCRFTQRHPVCGEWSNNTILPALDSLHRSPRTSKQVDQESGKNCGEESQVC